jgi:hypothetical protein
MSGDLTAPNVFGSTKVQAPEIKATTKIVFPDNSEQTTAATTAFPSGTVMLFVQSSAPTGWTKSTAHNDKALRVVSGSVSSGGSVAFSTAFASKSVSGSIGATTLSTAQMPSHSHIQAIGLWDANGSVRFGYRDSILGGSYYIDSPPSASSSGLTSSFPNTSNEGSGNSHTHSFTGTAIDMAVQYVDVIICTRN